MDFRMRELSHGMILGEFIKGILVSIKDVDVYFPVDSRHSSIWA